MGRSRWTWPSAVAVIVAGSVSSPHPTPSSMPLVEWLSEKHREMNHSTNSGYLSGQLSKFM